MSGQNNYNAVSDSGNRNHWQTLKGLASYLWPADRPDLRQQVLWAMLCLALAKGINVYVPFLYKDAIDTLSVKNVALALPLGLILAYGGARIMAQFFCELRDFIFIRVAQYAKHAIALHVFQHLHALSPMKYESKYYKEPQLSKKLGACQSAVDHYGDNAACEGFFGMLKREIIHHRGYRTHNEARADVFDYLKRFHNPKMRRRLAAQDLKFTSILTVRKNGIEPVLD